MDFREFCKKATFDTLQEFHLSESDLFHNNRWLELKESVKHVGIYKTETENLLAARKWCRNMRTFLVRLKNDKGRVR